MELIGTKELSQIPDLRHRLREMRWFRLTFQKTADAISTQYGLLFSIDQSKLDKVFSYWLNSLTLHHHFVRINRADFIIFASGLVLRELIRCDPANCVIPQQRETSSNTINNIPEVVSFWPEGFLYTNYCISVIIALFSQEFERDIHLSNCVDDLRTWWSFKENAKELPAYAIAYLDKFLGQEPNWRLPDVPELRQAMKRVPECLVLDMQHIPKTHESSPRKM